MEDNRMVFHDGEVIGREGGNVRVKIISRSACVQCHVKVIFPLSSFSFIGLLTPSSQALLWIYPLLPQ